MADGILIILLSFGFLILMVQWLIFVFQVKKDPYWNSPTYKHRKRMRQQIYNYLYRHPSSDIRLQYPHLADTAEAAKAYERLNYLYEAGMIDEIDYNLELEKLLPMVNIEGDF